MSEVMSRGAKCPNWVSGEKKDRVIPTLFLLVGREREKTMQIPPVNFPGAGSSESEVEERERELKRDFKTPLGGSYLVAWMIVILVVIGLLLLGVFHPLW